MAHCASGKETIMVLEKRQLSLEDLEAQTALELPDRETLATVVAQCVAVCIGSISIRNISVNVGAQVCAAILSINAILGTTAVTCTVNGQAQ